ncbi:ATP-binding protein [Streptomyces chartreusis]|uniref:ATP-binding protein n=1 Tax=Streptomyces chartreusis TaxID=1969 RepID=UPI0033D784AD
MNRMVPGPDALAASADTITELVQHLETIADSAEKGQGERRQQLLSWMAAEVDVDPVVESFGSPALKEVTLPSRPEAARLARLLIDSVLRQQWRMSDHITDSAVLMGSELVANVVQHTPARILGLRLKRPTGRIRVEVRDPSRGLPCLMPLNPQDTRGRGLRVIDQLSDRWGVDLLPRGKITWFELRIATPQERTRLQPSTHPDATRRETPSD